ncbi:uncharacterized protein KRP23_2612 [Phytophthora ramorum]|uniref:uncharacterized protein n=1 Tax=Phytophthora ramorum TaxID=164328 RepID=UPI0030B3CE09|nr:hypothetical protein KRP23_2612 [Phytophthora ramorum]
MATKHGIRLSVLGALGVAVSSYGVYVKRQKLAWKDEYSALCDVERFSCSQVLTSEYSSLLAYWGIVEKRSLAAGRVECSFGGLGVLSVHAVPGGANGPVPCGVLLCCVVLCYGGHVVPSVHFGVCAPGLLFGVHCNANKSE